MSEFVVGSKVVFPTTLYDVPETVNPFQSKNERHLRRSKRIANASRPPNASNSLAEPDDTNEKKRKTEEVEDLRTDLKGALTHTLEELAQFRSLSFWQTEEIERLKIDNVTNSSNIDIINENNHNIRSDYLARVHVLEMDVMTSKNQTETA